MRILMWFALGFGAACCGCAYILPEGYAWTIGLLILAATIVLQFVCKKLPDLRSAVLVFLGCGVGLLWWQAYDSAYLSVPRVLDDTIKQVHIEFVDYSSNTSYGTTAEGRVVLDGKTYKVWTYLNDTDVQIKPGDTVSGKFRIHFSARNRAGGLSTNSTKGIFLSASAMDSVTVGSVQSIPLRYQPAVLRHRILNYLDEAFPDDTAGFAKALLLGEDADLNYEIDTAFKISGIRHIIAVSGLHVSILCSFLYFLTGKQRFVTAAAATVVLLLFAAVVGFTPSISRACIMMLLMQYASLFNREYDAPTELAFSALVLLLINPMVIASVSFQLSFACMAGILLFATPIRKRLLRRWEDRKEKPAKILRAAATGISVSLGAMVFTVPLTAYYFGMVSLIGVLTNLLVLWVISFIFYGVIIVVVAAAIYLPCAKLLAWCIAWPMRYVILTAKVAAKMPLAAVYTDNGVMLLWLALCYILLFIGIKTRGRHTVSLVSIAVLALCVGLLFTWHQPRQYEASVTSLDVGQGQCILLQSEGKTFLVDCGGDYDTSAADVAANALLRQGIACVDGVIVTHYDTDHCGGISYLLSRIDTRLLLVPGYEENELQKKDAAFVIAEDTTIYYGNTTLKLYPSKTGNTSNESSMCVLFQTENCDILITGDRTADGEQELMRREELPQLEVLVVGHHGASSSTSEVLLQATRPKTAIISVGKYNSYGHPSIEVLQRLDAYGCEVHRTDLEGTILYRG